MIKINQLKKQFDVTAEKLSDKGVSTESLKKLWEQVETAYQNIGLLYPDDSEDKVFPPSWSAAERNENQINMAFIEQICKVDPIKDEPKRNKVGYQVDASNSLDDKFAVLINTLKNNHTIDSVGYMIEATAKLLDKKMVFNAGEQSSHKTYNSSAYRRNLNVAAHDLLASVVAMDIDSRQNHDIFNDYTNDKGLGINSKSQYSKNRVDFDSFWKDIKSSANEFFSPDANKQAAWEYQISQSAQAIHFTSENVSRFIGFLESSDERRFGRGADFYLLITVTDGVPASRAGALVSMNNGDETGFWDSEAKRRQGTVGDQVRQTLLEQLPSPSTKASTFGTTFEFLAKEAFEEKYYLDHGVRLESVKNEYYSKLVQTEATGDYRNGLDEFYYDDKNDKYIVAEFKMPQALSQGFEKANKYSTIIDDYIYQSSLYKAAAQEVMPSGTEIEVCLFQFGMQGLGEYQLQINASDKKADDLAVKLIDTVKSSIRSGSPLCRYKSNVIETSPELVNDVLLPALDKYNDYLNSGIAPKEPWNHRATFDDDGTHLLYELEHKHAALNMLAESIENQNTELKEQMAEISILAGEPIKGPMASTTTSMRLPTPDILFDRACEAGLDKSLSDYLVDTQITSVNVDFNLVKSLGEKHDIDVTKLQKVITSMQPEKKYTNKPVFEQIAQQTLRSLEPYVDKLSSPKSEPEPEMSPEEVIPTPTI